MLLSVKMKNEAVCEWLQTQARAGLGVSWLNGMIDKFIYKQQFHFQQTFLLMTV